MIVVFSQQPAIARNDDYIKVLEKTISEVNASVNATLKLVEEALEEPGQDAPKPPVKPEVLRVMFTTGIRDNEPVNNLSELTETKKLLFFYTDLAGMANRRLEHHWYYDNEQLAVEQIVPRQQRWQAFSRMQLHRREGLWAAELVNEDGQVMQRKELVYTIK